jgi:hypothetical protein
MVVADLCTWLRSSPLEKFLIGTALAGYIVFFRAFLFKYISFAFWIEWMMLCLIAWLVYRNIQNILRSRHTNIMVEHEWQKHIQHIDDLIDEDFIKIALLQRDFVETGARRDLLNYLKQVLYNNNLADDQINEALIRLIEYSDKKIPWYLFWIWRKRKVQENLENRKIALNTTIDKLAAWSHPKKIGV